MAATIDGAEVDLSTVLPDGAEVAVLTADSDAGRARSHGSSTRKPIVW